jgi:anti-anti-sigma factor
MNPAPSESFLSPVALSTQLLNELGDPRSTLRAAIQRNGPAVIVLAGGEVDASNEDAWRQLIGEAAAVASGPGPFIVDVAGLDFMGCCAFAVLAAEAERCRDRGVELRLVSCDSAVARLVRAGNLDRLLPLHPTTDSALSTAASYGGARGGHDHVRRLLAN